MVFLAVVFFLLKLSKVSSKDIKTPSFLPYEERDECPYNEESLTKILNNDGYNSMRWRMEEYNLKKWKKIPRDYIVKLWKKGYHWFDIIQLWGWQIFEKEIPDLTSQKRIGAINGLTFMPDPQKIDEESGGWLWVGRVKDLIVIVQKVPNSESRINIDERFGFGNEDERGDRGQVRKIINYALQLEKLDPRQYEVSVLWAIGAQRFGKEADINFGNSSGGSGGSAIYLALLSALQQKPISRQVAATGVLTMLERKGMINGQQIVLEPGTNLPITGLQEKITACVKKELIR